MKKLTLWIQRYLIFISPIVVATMIWGSFQSDTEIRKIGNVWMTDLWEVMSWSLMVWFLLLFVFLLLLAFRKETQESTIKYLAGIKERDEREHAIMEAAARRTFVATSGLLILLLFLSTFTVSVAKLRPDQIVDGKKSSLSLGFKFLATEPHTTQSADGTVIFEQRDLPLSKSAIILLILIWQTVIFRFNAHKQLKLPE